MNSLISAIKAFVLKSRPAYKDYLGNGKYDVKKLPEECVPDSVNNKIRSAQSTANNAQRKANNAQRTADDAQSTANEALTTANSTSAQINDVTTFVTVFASLEATKNKERHNFAENIWLNGTSSLPLAEAKAPMKCYFDIMLNDSNNHNIKHYAAFEGKIVREVTKRSDTYCLFIDESVEVVNGCFAKLKIGYKFSNDDNLWHKFIRAEVTLPDADYNNTSITTIILNASGVIPDTYDYAPWPSICVPLAGTNDAGVVYASDKTDDQTVPVSIDKNGYLWCKGSETTTPDYNQNDPTARDYIKNRPFYDGAPVKTEIIPESTVTFSAFNNSLRIADFTEKFIPIEGETYSVYWDGTEYVCVCTLFEEGFLYLGNLYIAGGDGYDNTGEPFVFVVTGQCIAYTSDNSTYEHLIGIKQMLPQINQINKKYIPDDAFAQSDWDEQDETNVSFVRNKPLYLGKENSITVEQTTKSVNAGDNYIQYTGECSFNAGTSYRIFGKIYSCPHLPEIMNEFENFVDEIDMISLCNNDGELEVNFTATNRNGGDDRYGAIEIRRLYDITKRTPYTRDVCISNTKLGTAREYVFKINLTVAATKQIDSLLIPDSIQRVGGDVIIPSSTPNSTKKFKITVDDTGAISATEVI